VGVVARPRLGLPDADRIVGLQLWDAEANAAVFYDFSWETRDE
jgi:hypothetical protein